MIMAYTKITKPITINAASGDVVFDGFDFTENGTMTVTNAKNITIRNSRVYNIKGATSLIKLNGESKVTIEDCFFGNNVSLETIVNISGKMLAESSISKNYFSENAFNKYVTILTNVENGNYKFTDNTFETVDRPYSFNATGSPNVTVDMSNNILKTENAGSDGNGPALCHIFVPAGAVSYGEVTFSANNLTGVKNPITVFVGTSSAQLTDEQMPKCVVDGMNIDIVVTRQNAVCKIGNKQYLKLNDAIASAKAGNTITLMKNIECDNTGLSANTDPVFLIPANVSLDGAGNSIIAKNDTWVGTNKNHILGITDGATSVKNITLVGNAKTKSGFVAYGTNVVVEINNVEINNCGNCGMQIVNGANVTIDEYRSTGNVWGSINADKGTGGSNPTVKYNSGTMAENVEIYTEVLDGTVVTAPTLTEVIGVGDKLKGFKYFTSNKKRLGVAAVTVDGVTTVYENLEEAQSAASEAGVEVEVL